MALPISNDRVLKLELLREILGSRQAFAVEDDGEGAGAGGDHRHSRKCDHKKSEDWVRFVTRVAVDGSVTGAASHRSRCHVRLLCPTFCRAVHADAAYDGAPTRRRSE